MKDVYMQMLLHFNKDFDDDILLDMMNVLGLEWVIAILYTFNQFINKIRIVKKLRSLLQIKWISIKVDKKITLWSFIFNTFLKI